MSHKLLPPGSIVRLVSGSVPLMIVARQPIVNILKMELVYFDYAAINPLIGIEMDKIAYFNQENIAEILFEGYVSEHEERIQSTLDQWCEQNETIPKGKV